MSKVSKVYWTMRNGEKVSVDDMDITHLRNVLKMILRNRRKLAQAKPSFQLNGDMAQQFNDSFNHGPDIGDDPWWDIHMD